MFKEEFNKVAGAASAKNQLLKYPQTPLIIEETLNLEEQAKSRLSETD